MRSQTLTISSLINQVSDVDSVRQPHDDTSDKKKGVAKRQFLRVHLMCSPVQMSHHSGHVK